MLSSVSKIHLLVASALLLNQASGAVAAPKAKDTVPPPKAKAKDAVAAPKNTVASTLEEALIAAYQNNPELQAAQADLRAADEKLPQALAGFRPQLKITGNAQNSQQNTSGDTKSPNSNSQQQYGMQGSASLTQPIYNGGSTVASVEGAEQNVKAARAKLKATEQKVLLDGAKVFFDLFTKHEEGKVLQENYEIVQKFLEFAKEKYAVGEDTKTSISQAETRVADATARLALFKAQLEGLKAEYRRVIGREPGATLVKPKNLPALPKTLKAAIAMALDLSPSLQQARFQEAAARTEIDRIGGNLKPSLNLQASTSVARNYADNTRSVGPAPLFYGSGNTYNNTITLQAEWQLYDGGAVRGQRREAFEKTTSAKLSIEQARLQVIADVTATWEQYAASQENITARQAQLVAQNVSVTGTEEEVRVGAKILLDVLDEQRKRLEVQQDLINAEASYYKTHYSVMATTGTLTHDRLKLKVRAYNPENHYTEARNSVY